MNVTEIAPESTTSPEYPSSSRSRRWGEEGGPRAACWRTDTRYRNGEVYQQSHLCHTLTCEYCGPQLREAAWKEAWRRYQREAEEGHLIYVTYVRAEVVSRLRNQAARQDQPIESVPISQDWNAVFSTHPMTLPAQLRGGRSNPLISTVVNHDEIRRIFLQYRTHRRQHTKSGRWAPKASPRKPSKDDGVTLSRDFISRDALENVAKRLGLRVKSFNGTVWFKDERKLGPDFFKKVLHDEEHRLRGERRRAIGLAA